MSLVSKNQEFRELHNYYTTRRLNPLKKMQSLVAIAAKLIRVFYAMLTKGVDYDPKKMVSDITYIPTREGWLYLAVVIDLFSRAILGWKLGESLGAELVSAATGTLETLFALNPAAVGGALPGEDFWFGA